MRATRTIIRVLLLLSAGRAVPAQYVNFEASQVHPIALTPDGAKLLAVNTPDALLEVFAIDGTGAPVSAASIPVGLEPVTVVARTSTEAWVVNQLSDTISIVDLGLGMTVRTLAVGNEPTDVTFAAGKAFVAVSHEDSVKVYDLANLSAAPVVVPLFASNIRALAVSNDGGTVYAVSQDSGNQTTVVDGNIIFGNNANLNASRLAALGVNTMNCSFLPPAYPAMPAGIARNPALTDPADGIPKVGLIVKWNPAISQWVDEQGQLWTKCLPFRMPDHDLFAIDANQPSNAPVAVDHVGTTLFEVSVNPRTGKVYVPNTESLNFTRFEPRVKGHVVDDRLSIVDPVTSSVTVVDLNTHIDRASDPATNLAERSASISQPGMLVWKSDGSIGYMTAIGSRKLFAVAGTTGTSPNVVTCLDGNCIVNPIHSVGRASPDAVDVGEGPSGVALLESRNRVYVLNRFSNSIAWVDAPTLTKLGETALHDPSSPTIKQGRRFLYDAILSSGHGDAACSSCHISGNKDGISWDLGDPTGNLVPYSTILDNVRFVAPVGGQPTSCDPAVCAVHAGFDPQKGPMATQTLRAMLEPLHWRGDRATMNDFNPAFVSLMGAHDVGPITGKPAGLSASDMETYRQFALALRFPPNPNRNVDDTLPSSLKVLDRPAPAGPLTGNPSRGETVFNTGLTDENQPCAACHTLPFGAAGGKLGGVTPQEPTAVPDAAALLNGTADQSRHSDVKIPHLRNIVDKPGFLFGPAAGPFPDVKAGIGFGHDGAVPNLPTFFSFNVFTMTATDAADVSAFALSFSTGTKPSVGRNLTCPAGPPPQAGCDETLLSTLISLGDLANANRHCELTATALSGGRPRAYRLSGSVWRTDVAGEPALTTAALRQGSASPITFLCATIGSGLRLGGDRDEDGVLNGDDCAPADAGSWSAPSQVSGVIVAGTAPTQLAWTNPSVTIGPGVHFDVAGGLLSALRSDGLPAATSCIAGNLATAAYNDARPDPPADDAYFYLIRSENACGSGGFGPGRGALDALACIAP
jgi:DNA-binding beta-propeller fold protein YncE/mono/diheme cytochrome c family protein